MVFKRTRSTFFFIISAVLLLPVIQHTFSFITSKGLTGDIVYAADTVFTIDGWFKGSYQEKKNAYLNDNLGFRSDLVRLNNQVDYSFFKKAHAEGVVVGKDNYLYEKGYIDAYCGTDYKYDEDLPIKLGKLKALQDTFQKLGKRLIVLCAPSKARYYNDHFPPGLQLPEGKHNIYKQFTGIVDSLKLQDIININAWFADQRAHTKHLLFSKYGIHWTYYGALLAMDSLVRYIEAKDNIDMPDIVIDKMAYSDRPMLQEQDIGEGLNIFAPLEVEQFTRPEFHYTNDSTKTKPKMIFIGDSFLWTISYVQVPQNISNDWQVWYYFKQVWSDDVSDRKISDFDWQGAMAGADHIILVNTELKLSYLGHGFIEKAYEHYYPQ